MSVKTRKVYAKTHAVREEIAALRASGLLQKDIAEATGLSRQTVGYHLQQIEVRVGTIAEVKGFRELESERRKTPFVKRERTVNKASRQPQPEPVKPVALSLDAKWLLYLRTRIGSPAAIAALARIGGAN